MSGFLTDTTVREEDLPLPEHRREPSRQATTSFLGSIWQFLTGTKPIAESELPEAVGRLSPARESKRQRDDSVTPAAAEASSPRTPAPFPVVQEDTVETLLKNNSSQLTVQNLTEYLLDNGVQLPPSAKKADLLKLARATSEGNAGAASPGLAAASAASLGRASTGSVAKTLASPARTPATKVQEDTVETLLKSNSSQLTVQNLTEYLNDKGVQLPPNARKADLLKLARTASEGNAGAASPALAAASAASLNRASTGSLAKTPSTPAAADVAPAAAPAAEAEAESDELPTLKWTLVQLKEYAEKKKIKLPAQALKPDIFDLISQHPDYRKATSVKRTTSQASLAREESKTGGKAKSKK